ncbi:replication initiator [Sphaerisporangium perillae]|uniref:replication initiator n=1 Tax=Sphaerisporangium perillae TaxID=2935860 RepID=UPI00200DEA42|nr:replication initiator [Sphaerisporangium perillae]
MNEVPSFSPEIFAAAQRASMPDFVRWQEMVRATGGCAEPIRLQGHRVTFDAGLEVLDVYRTADEPTGYLLTACGNRRASRCPACAEVYRDDTYHLILSGLRGGKGVPEEVSAHPRVFATFTAPSFGAVHARRERDGKTLPCRPRRDKPLCEHGRPEGCGVRHEEGDPQIGQPVCVDCYDYRGAVLWNAHAGELWRRFTQALPATFARLFGVSRAALRRRLRLSYAKVAEYQARGLVHFHAVIRLDGPDGPCDCPPDWATVPVLAAAIRETAAGIAVPVPEDAPAFVARWGDQLDVEPIYVATALEGLADQRVASYIAKYSIKGAESAGTVDRPIRQMRDVAFLNVTEHARRMIYTCFVLNDQPEYRLIPFRRWAHMLGYRGHFSTKSRHYSTTLGTLRQVRADHQAEQSRQRRGLPDPGERQTVTVGEWRYAGSGYRHGGTLLGRTGSATHRHSSPTRTETASRESPA